VVSTTVLLLPEFLPDLVEDDAVVFSFNDPSGRRSYTTSADATVPLTPGFVDRDLSSGDWAHWVVRFKEETGVFPSSQLHLVASESAETTD
jgi:hypothetical protein